MRSSQNNSEIFFQNIQVNGAIGQNSTLQCLYSYKPLNYQGYPRIKRQRLMFAFWCLQFYLIVEKWIHRNCLGQQIVFFVHLIPLLLYLPWMVESIDDDLIFH